MVIKTSTYIKIGIGILFLFFICGIGYWAKQNEFFKILLLYGPAFILYLLIFYFVKSHKETLFFVGIAIAARILLIPAFPSLSDDIYRFLWDGQLIRLGINPLAYTPQEWLNLDDIPMRSWFEFVYPQLNSQQYFTIYPPVCQAFFTAAVHLFPMDLYAAQIFLKCMFVACEIGTIYLLLKLLPFLKMPQKRILLYALNPLIIIELTGNLHFEAVMIFFLILSLWLLFRNKHLLFGITYALSIATKLTPLIFGPLLLFRMRARSAIQGFGIAAIFLIILFYPFIDSGIWNFFESVNLYFQRFEFNASLYYLFRWLGFKIVGYNIIHQLGPLLSIISLLLILLLSMVRKNKSHKNILSIALIVYSIYLFGATTVHPWYISLCIILSTFTYMRYPIFWSGLIILSYSHYYHDYNTEFYWLLFIEYGVVYFVFMVEIFKWPVMKYLVKGYTKLISLYRRADTWR